VNGRVLACRKNVAGRALAILLCAASFLSVDALPVHAAMLYGITLVSSGDTNLVTIDPNTGATTLVGL